MQKIGFLCVLLIAMGISASAIARTDRHITCEMVRAYVARVGAVEARQVAKAHGMTPSEERRARRCLRAGLD